MTKNKRKESLLITLTGPDQTGITARMAELLDTGGAELIDVEQVVVQGYLNLHFLVQLGEDDGRSLLKDMLWSAREMGLQLELELVGDERNGPAEPRKRWAVTLVAQRLNADLLAAAANAAASNSFNIDKIERLSEGTLSSIELTLSGDDQARPRQLKDTLLGLAARFNCDVALQRETLLRRSKRLVVFDMDSTLIQQEVIDEIARLHGVYDEVAAVTARAMEGDLDFETALRQRCSHLAGAPETIFEEVLKCIELTPGAQRFVTVLHRLGYKLAVVSGGFIQVAEPLRQRLGLDYAFANQLEVVDGKLTGNLVGTIVDRQRKADLLESMAQAERISLQQVIAVGDGANDLNMLDRAGLGIAFNAKRIVQEKAEYAINQRGLDTVLYLLGIRQEDIRAVA